MLYQLGYWPVYGVLMHTNRWDCTHCGMKLQIQNEFSFTDCMLDLNSSGCHYLISKHNNQINQRLAVDQTLGSVLYQQPRKLVRMYNSVHTLHFNILLSDDAVFENTSLPKVANLAKGLHYFNVTHCCHAHSVFLSLDELT